jgi:hypothetical protein
LASGSTAVGEDLKSLFGGVEFAAAGRGHAVVEANVQLGLLFVGAIILGCQVECTLDDLGGVTAVAEFDLALDLLFELGVDGQSHGSKIPLVGLGGNRYRVPRLPRGSESWMEYTAGCWVRR